MEAFGPGLFMLVFVLIASAVVAIAYWQWQLAKQRRADLSAWAAKQGLSYSAEDVWNLPGSYRRFGLFTRGDGRGCENVVQGEWQGLSLIEADYWYYDTSHDSKGGTSRSYSHHSVVLVSLDAVLPNVSIERENVLTRLADAVGMRDIEFELEEFNRRFNVKCDDREFAYKLLDARMMEYLLGKAGNICVEVDGGHALVWSGKVKPAELTGLLYRVKGFVDSIPRLVWNEYGNKAAS